MRVAIVHLLVFLILTAAPLFVHLIFERVASAEGNRPPGRRILMGATAVVWTVLLSAFALDWRSVSQRPFDYWALGAAALLWTFCVISGERAARALTRSFAGTPETARHASLVPRRITRYLSGPALLSPYLVVVTGWGLSALRLVEGSPHHVRGAFGFGWCSMSFLLLYAWWLYDEACGPQRLAAAAAEDVEATRRARVRRVFRYQLALVTVFSSVEVLLAGLDLTNESARNLAAALSLGVALIGFAAFGLAVSRAFTRHLQEARARTILQ